VAEPAPRPSLRIPRPLLLSAAAAVVAAVVALAFFAGRVQQLRVLHASGPAWVFPSRVYSDGVTLQPGRPLSESYLRAHLARRGYRQARSPLAAPGTWAALPGGVEIFLRGFPDSGDPEGSGGPERVRVRLRDGYLTAVERLGGHPRALPADTTRPPRLEPVLVSMLFDEDRVLRSYVSIGRIPAVVQDAVIAAEDRRYFGHLGLDLRANARALIANLRSKEIREGGSTITQQLARGLFLGNQRTLTRKLAEIPLAVGLELLLSKEQILEMYLNSVYWGQAEGFGVAGVGEAARWYFGVPVESLRVNEAAILAAMIPAPNDIAPFEDPAEVVEKRNQVLDDMVETDRLPAATAARVKALPLLVRRGRRPLERFPSYSSYLRTELMERLPRQAAERWGLSIFTTMDLVWQGQAEAEMHRGLASLDASSRRRSRLQGAFVALEPVTGAVRAVVGGRNLKPGDFNRAVQARRQTGSAIKPIVYASAFETSLDLTPATAVPDQRREFGDRYSRWSPRNFGDEYHEQVTLALALARSLNVATTNLVEMVGPHHVAEYAARFGLGRLKPVMSIGLGSNEVSLLGLTTAFAAFPAGGLRPTPSPLRAVVDRAGRVLLRPEEQRTRVVEEPTAALMTGLLEDVVTYGVASPVRYYGFRAPMGGKTGTTNDFRDVWFVGFTPNLAAGVWVGYDKPRSIGRQAAHTALPIWARTMEVMLRGFPEEPFASHRMLQFVDIDPWNGVLADSSCTMMRVPFLPGTAPQAWCGTAGLFGYGLSDYDSLYLADSVWAAEEDLDEPEEPTPPDTIVDVVRDTTVIPEEPEDPDDPSDPSEPPPDPDPPPPRR
jgi:penicillin-binding protein 1B